MKLQTLILATLVSFNLDFALTTKVDANPMNCTPFRNSYENAIKSGAIKRPSAVLNEKVALDLALKASKAGKLREASIRMMQASVIVETSTNAEIARKFAYEIAGIIRHDQTLGKLLPKYTRFCKPA